MRRGGRRNAWRGKCKDCVRGGRASVGVCVSWAETVGRPLQSCWFGEWASSRGGRRAGVAFRALRLVGQGGHIAPARRLPRRPCLAWDPPLRVLGISRTSANSRRAKSSLRGSLLEEGPESIELLTEVREGWRRGFQKSCDW